MSFEVRDDSVVSRFMPTERHQGPPGIMHGGLVSTLIDEVGAWAIIGHRRKFGFTTSLACRFHRAVRIGEILTCTATITKETTRLMDVQVKLEQGDQLVTTGELRFVILARAAAEQLIGRSLPPEWAEFTR